MGMPTRRGKTEMAEEPDVVADATNDDEDHHPRGTFVLLLAFLAVTAGYWIWAYTTLLDRAAG
jgi:hypothetical protein